MTKAQLIARLATLPDDAEVMILDGFNGGGYPRELNIGPTRRVISKMDTIDSADCEEIEGETVIVLGYGCY